MEFKMLFKVVLLSCCVSAILSQDDDAAQFISPTRIEVLIKGSFMVPVQYTESNTPIKILVKGGDIVALYCHGNNAPIMQQARRNDVDSDGYRDWDVFLETNDVIVTKLLSGIPIYCNLINNSPEVEVIPFSITYTRTEGEPVVKPVIDPSLTMNQLIADYSSGQVEMSNTIIALLTATIVIALLVPIVLGIVNSRRVITI